MATITEVEKLASGSKVDLIVAAGETLQKQKIAVRLLSMPSWAFFEAQSHEYRDSVLPRFCQKVISNVHFLLCDSRSLLIMPSAY
jgi:transketolase